MYMQYVPGGTLLDAMRALYHREKKAWCGRAFVEVVDEVIRRRGNDVNYESTARKQLLASDWNETVCRVGCDLARALEYAHRRGVHHRDVKPANALIDANYAIKLADFNVSFASCIADAAESQFGGSLPYMSPEQLRAFDETDASALREMDHRSDIFSLGVVLYEFWSGQLPFPVPSASQHAAAQLRGCLESRERQEYRQSPIIKQANPLLRHTIERCLALSPDDRFRSARELATQLRIGKFPDAEKILFASDTHWSTVLGRMFLPLTLLVVVLFNGLAALFVFNFNLLSAVPHDGLRRFWFIQSAINSVAFPLAIVLFIFLTRSIWMITLKQVKPILMETSKLQRAISRNLACGHLASVICLTEWVLAGFLYPIILTISGVPLAAAGWTDFILSHSLAGLNITAISFFLITYMSIRIWLPVLIRNSLIEPIVETTIVQLRQTNGRTSIYLFLCIAAPLLAIAILSIFGAVGERNRFALSVISSFGIVTIPVVLVLYRQIQTICELLKRVFATGE
jgi:hypothetical protein